MPAMYLAGLPIPGSDVLELARLVDDTRLAERLETAYGNGARILALDVSRARDHDAGARRRAAHRGARRTSRRPPGRARRPSPGRSCVAVGNAGCVCPRDGEGTPVPCQTRRHSHPHPHRLYPDPTRCRPPIPRLLLSQTQSRQTRSDRHHGARPAPSGHPRREVLGRDPRSNRNE